MYLHVESDGEDKCGVHNHFCECASQDQVKSREGQCDCSHEKQKVDRMLIEGEGSSSVPATNAPSEAILANPCGNRKGRDNDKPGELL